MFDNLKKLREERDKKREEQKLKHKKVKAAQRVQFEQDREMLQVYVDWFTPIIRHFNSVVFGDNRGFRASWEVGRLEFYWYLGYKYSVPTIQNDESKTWCLDVMLALHPRTNKPYISFRSGTIKCELKDCEAVESQLIARLREWGEYYLSLE